MRVKFTVLHDEGDIVRQSSNFDLVPQDEDPASFDEALEYVQTNIAGLFEEEGLVFEENDEDADDIGTELLCSWIVYDNEELTASQARVLIARLVAEANVVIEDLE